MSTRRKKTIHIENKEWKFVVVQHGNAIEIRNIDNKKWLVKAQDLPGNEKWTPRQLSLNQKNDHNFLTITPGMIKHYIETKILGKNLPPFILHADDNDERQEKINQKHWLCQEHRTFVYSARSGWYNVDGTLTTIEHPSELLTKVKPLDVLTDFLSKIDEKVTIVSFDVKNEKETFLESIFAHRRRKSGNDTFALFCGFGNEFSKLIDASK